MKKRIFTTLMLLLGVVAPMLAVPARSHWQQITQPDGTVVTVKLCGDEFYHYYITQEGDYVTRGADGFFRYTTLDANNNLVESNTLATNGLPKQQSKQREAISLRHKEMSNVYRSRRAQAATAPMQPIARQAAEKDGEVKGLIILVNFADKAMVTPKEQFVNMMNKEGYTDSYGSIGSARDYFIDQSYGQFKPSFDIVGPVTLTRNMSYYGDNDRYGQDSRPDVMITDACQIASSEGLVNMADYDCNGDGWVDLVYVIYAGNSESSGAPESSIWPHAWYIYQGAGRTVKIDGVKLDAYACSSELYVLSDTQYEGIGTFCHEYSHTLGLPDLYDVDYSGGMGMLMWSLMDFGSYGCDGYIPPSFTAFERKTCGWIELNELNKPCTLMIPDLNNDATAAYVITSDNENQFITLETRTQRGWDKSLPAEGLMITAIDYDKAVWERNQPNDDPSRQRVKLIPADNQWTQNTVSGDLYPYKGNNSLTSTTKPSMKVYTTLIKDKPITNITYEDGISTLDFMGGGTLVTLDTPVALQPKNVSETQFTALWEAVPDAQTYMLQVERLDEYVDPNIIFDEKFEGFTANSSVEISNIIDNYTEEPGWSATNIYCANGAVQMGSSNQSSLLETPQFNAPNQCAIFMDIALCDKSSSTGSMKIIFQNDKSYAATLPLGEFKTDFRSIVIACYYGKDDSKLVIETDKPVYIDNISIEKEIPKQSRAAQRYELEESDELRYVAAAQSELQVSERAIFSNISSTQYEVTEVESNVRDGIYRYKVKAMSEEGQSNWSNVIEVMVKPNANATMTTRDASRVFATHNGIKIEGEGGKQVSVYNMQGHLVDSFATIDGVTTRRVATSGIYIVRCDDNVTKVVVK